MPAKPSPPPPENFWDRLLGRTRDKKAAGRPASSPPSDAARLAALLRQREAELRQLKALLAKTQEALRQAEENIRERDSVGEGDAERKTWLLQKGALQDDLRDALERAQLAEDRLEAERGERARFDQKTSAAQESLAKNQERILELEADVAWEKSRADKLDDEKRDYAKRLEEVERNFNRALQEAQSHNAAEVSTEVILLREKIEELSQARRAAEEHAASARHQMNQELAALRESSENSAHRALEEAESRRREVEEELSRARQALAETTAARIKAEDEALGKSEELEALSRQVQEERAAMAEERLRREEEMARAKGEAAAPAAEAPPAGPEMEQLLEELDALTAENAGLQDEIRILQSKLKEPG